MTRMGQFDPEAPAVHVWTGDEDIPGFAPLEVPELVLAGPMPPDVIKKRSKGLRTRKLATPGWKMVTGDVAVVRGNVDTEMLKATSVYTSELNVMLRSHLGGSPEQNLFSTRLFFDPREYRRQAARAGAANAESYYDPRSAEIVMHIEHWSAYIFQRAFAHEFCHAYIDREHRKTGPLWLMEGLAEWFSNIQWRGDIFVPGQMNSRALLILNLNQDLITMKGLLDLPREAMYGMEFAAYYALAWSLVDYVMTQMPHGSILEVLHGDPHMLLANEEAWRGHMRMMLSTPS